MRRKKIIVGLGKIGKELKIRNFKGAKLKKEIEDR